MSISPEAKAQTSLSENIAIPEIMVFPRARYQILQFLHYETSDNGGWIYPRDTDEEDVMDFLNRHTLGKKPSALRRKLFDLSQLGCVKVAHEEPDRSNTPISNVGITELGTRYLFALKDAFPEKIKDLEHASVKTTDPEEIKERALEVLRVVKEFGFVAIFGNDAPHKLDAAMLQQPEFMWQVLERADELGRR